MAKKSPAELKAESDAISGHIAVARKRPLNFALLIGKEGVVLAAHPTKGPDVMRREAKANGGGPKGTIGVMNVNGKVIELTCIDEDAPRNLSKLARKYFKDLGLAFKIVMILPNGERIGDEDDGDEDAAEEAAETLDAVGEAPEEEPEDPRKAELTERCAALVAAAAQLPQGQAGLDKIAEGLRRAQAGVDDGRFDDAATLLDAIEKGINRIKALAEAAPVAAPAPQRPSDLDEGLVAALQRGFDALSGDMTAIAARADRAVAGKATQIAGMFTQELAKPDLKKAGAVLSLLKKFVTDEAAKLGAAPSVTSTVPPTGDPATPTGGVETPAAPTAPPTGGDPATPPALDEAAAANALATAGVTDQSTLDVIIAAARRIPEAIRQATAKAAEIRAANIPLGQMLMLLRLYFTEPQTFDATMAAMTSLDPSGALDVSEAGLTAKQAEVDAAQQVQRTKQAALDVAYEALAVARAAYEALDAECTTLDGDRATKDAALLAFEAGLPDPATMTPEELAAVDVQRNQLAADLQAAADALAAKEAERQLAADAHNNLLPGVRTAEAENQTANADYWARRGEQDELNDKKGLLDALSFGPLSPGATPPFDDAQKAGFAAAYGANPDLGRSAMDIARNAEDPAMVANNLPGITAAYSSGFADSSGNSVQRDGADLSGDDRAAMAANALRNGARQGQGYFDGFSAYLQTGQQYSADPSGGMDPALPDRDAEAIRQKEVAVRRSAGMGAAVLQPDGTVNFDTPAAQAEMDMNQFHPGALLVPTPVVTDKMREVRGLFADPTTGPQAQNIVTNTHLPDPADPDVDAVSAAQIVGDTVGKAPADVTDTDSQVALLSAMMTPLSQGPVGSCFTTAPTRKIREEDPLRAMQAFSDISTTGQFETFDGDVYPANVTHPEGENALMRSWEYSVADAAAEDANSDESQSLSQSLGGLSGVRAIVGDAAWAGGGTDATGALIPGVEAKLLAAVRTELVYVYNTDPLPPGAGAGGDGHSDSGYYELRHNGTLISDEAGFLAAVKEIAIGAAGVASGSPEETAIIALVDSAPFLQTIKDTVRNQGYTAPDFEPWNIGGGGWEYQTSRTLNGGAPARATPPVVAEQGDPPPSIGDRSRGLLDGVLAQRGAMNPGMSIVSTSGTDANHAFNALPNHPSLQAIADPDSAAKIQAQLLDPGAAIANGKMSVAEGQAFYRAEISKLADYAWQVPAEEDLIRAALGRVPTTELTPREMSALIDTEMDAYKTAAATRLADEWKTEQESDGTTTVTPAQYAARLAAFKAGKAEEVQASGATRMASMHQLPQVVIADTNWGGANSQLQFVIAPDPMTGELRLWEKDTVTGRLSPSDAFARAEWQRMTD